MKKKKMKTKLGIESVLAIRKLEFGQKDSLFQGCLPFVGRNIWDEMDVH